MSVEQIMAAIRRLSVGELAELLAALRREFGDDPPASGVREPRRPKPSDRGAAS
jgi:ribosomal protein L7/L12